MTLMTICEQPVFVTKLSDGMRRCECRESLLVVAVSGGADSVALLRGLMWLRASHSLSLRVAHLNHQLRDADADADADWVRRLCQSLNIPCDVETRNVAALAEARHVGIEEAAREARYQFLAQVARDHGANAVAVAHSLDDQAETVLHHIVRGTGLSGLRGMSWSRELVTTSDEPALRLIRPMLGIHRAEVEEFLADLKQEFRQDVTNDDVTWTRNRLRREVLPALARDINPRAREHLCRLAEQAADAEEAIRFAAEQLCIVARLDQSTDPVRLRVTEFAHQPRAIIREAFVRLWWSLKWDRRAMTFDHWQTLADMTQLDGPTSTNLPGNLVARRRGQLLAIERLAHKND